VRGADLAQVIEIDAKVTGLRKRSYWRDVFERYGRSRGRGGQRFFLVAAEGARINGFVVGEVRDWEFGSPPCGWVFGINVRPDARLSGVGTQLLGALCEALRRAGVSRVRTLLARDNAVILSFFRSQGMMVGPFIPLEKELE
jgi:GNAT superfamily N-acetyltransferase